MEELLASGLTMPGDPNSDGNPLLVVGVGISLHGIDALPEFLRAVAAGRGLAFVVVCHSDNGPEGLPPALRGDLGPFEVVDAADGSVPAADRVLVVPAGQLAGLDGGVIRLTPAHDTPERSTAVDRLLTALARDRGDRAVAVVLSGAGSDGSLGLTAVADAGGLTLAQEPLVAAFGGADFVLSPTGLARELVAHADHRRAAGPHREAELAHEVREALPEICEILQAATGHNFKHYKTNTLARRTLRRLLIVRAESAAGYVALLRADPAEAVRLFKELLINVTAFFRDPEAFAALDRLALAELVNGRPPGDPVRVWVAGCATGEEAYSLAMLLRERLDGLPDPPPVQIFATDIDAAALATARSGAYPLGIADEVSPERLARFFVKAGAQYRVTKEIRELVLFSDHNLINDPPFSRLDLVSCRNLLIYLGQHLQQKLIPLFHYALRPGGFLFLGPSESLSTHRELFRPIDTKFRLSRRLPTAIRPDSLAANRDAPGTTVRPPNAPTSAEAETYQVMQRIVLDEFAPKAVVVDEEGQVVCASGNLEKYLTLSAGTFQNNVTRLVRDGLSVGLRAALAEAARVRRRVDHDGMSLRTDAGVQRVMVTVQPMPQLGEGSGLFMVVFQDVGRPLAPGEEQRPDGADAGGAALIEQLERELTSTRGDLEKTVQDLEAANEELKSSNEELLSMNEELQSSNEELETSKEEVQAANSALAGANGDLESLLASTRIPTLFLDEAGRVRRATAAAAAVYNIRPTDAGRPLGHFTHNAVEMPPIPPAAEVRAGARDFLDEVALRDGTFYQRRVLPYRAADGTSDGVVVTFTDVTERKRVEESLALSEERYRLTFEYAAIGIAQVGLDGRWLQFNPALCAITGRTAEELATLTFQDITYPDDLDGDVANYRRLMAGDIGRYSMEKRYVRPDGSTVWVNLTASLLRDSGGEPRHFISVIEDITARRAAADARRHSELRLAEVLHLAPSFMAVLRGPDHVYELANEKYYEIIGRRDILGRTVAEALPEVVAQGYVAVLDEVLRTGEPFVVTAQPVELQRTPGAPAEVRTLDFVFQPLRDAAGLPTGIIIQGIDWTDRYRAQRDATAAAAESDRLRRKYDTVLSNTPDYHYVFDRRGHFTYGNRAVVELFGLASSAEMAGRHPREIVRPPELADRLAAQARQAIETRAPVRAVETITGAFGPRVYDYTIVPIFAADGSVEAATGSGRDVTDHTQVEERLREADRRKDVFLATLAHELRNPLAPLRNGLQLLRDADPHAAAATRDMMERQLAHIVRLVDDLLDLSRINSGKLELRRERTDLAAVVESAVEASRPLIDRLGHALTVELPATPVALDADPVRLAQVFTNLLNNAAKYSERAGRVSLTAAVEGDAVAVRVRDTGIGIAADQLARVFTMFAQVPGAGDKSQGGLGIGLALVKGIVETHGGTVTVESAGDGRGCEFAVRLPLATGTGTGTVEAASPIPATPLPEVTWRILVADDNFDAAESLGELLELYGHDVVVAHDGEAAVSAAETHRPEVVLLDLGMPKLSGFAVARQLRATPWGAGVTLIAQTGWGSAEDRRKTHEAGFDRHLVKPVDPKELLKLLAELERPAAYC
jgi:two-component system CheB/CheR fusion protein